MRRCRDLAPGRGGRRGHLGACPARRPCPGHGAAGSETTQVTYAIPTATYNAQTTLAHHLAGHYARAEDEAYALIREALTGSGDIHPASGHLLIRLDLLTAPRRTRPLGGLCQQLNTALARYPGTDLVLRHEGKPHPTAA